jgi:hypothetical protein
MFNSRCLLYFFAFTFSLVSSLSISGAAQASGVAKITVIDQQVESDTQIFPPNFDINKQLGRAWVEVGTDDTFSNVGTITALVSGLSYDIADKQIVYISGNKRVVCANVKGPTVTVPLGDTIVPTDNCKLNAKLVERDVDSGTDTYTGTFLHVEMEVAE